VALATGQMSNIGTTSRPMRAHAAEPEAVVFPRPVPEGYSVCVNCLEVIPAHMRMLTQHAYAV
jgi:hypothetical protein